MPPLHFKALKFTPSWSAYFASFVATSPTILPPPLSTHDLSLEPLTFNRCILKRPALPFGLAPSERFLLHRRLTSGSLVRLLHPLPRDSPPPAHRTPPGFSLSEIVILRRVWAALPPSWRPPLRTCTLGPSLYGVHRLTHTLEPSTLLHICGTFNESTLVRAQDTSLSDGVPLPACATCPPFPFPSSALLPVYYSPSGQCIGGGFLPWLGHRLDLAAAPRSPALYH